MKLPWPHRKSKKRTSSGRKPRLMEGQDSYVFRRSRTITGTTASSVTASASARGQFKTDRIKLMELRQHRRQILKFLGIICIAVVVLIFLVVNFTVMPAISFPQKGAHTPQLADYQKSIDNYFNDHPFERFGFLLQQSTLEEAIIHDRPEVLAVAMHHDWYGGNVQLSIAFRQPLLRWSVGTKQFYVDAQGAAFTYNHFSEPGLTVTDQSGIAPDKSGIVASARFIRFLGQIVNAVDTYGLGTVNAVIIPPATREIDLKLTGRNYIIKTNTDRDPLQEAEDIANALKYFDQHKVTPVYIDVRVAHKAFYR